MISWSTKLPANIFAHPRFLHDVFFAENIKFLSPIITISGARNWTITSVSGSRNIADPFSLFLAPEIVIFWQFLGPEIVKMGQHISGPRNWHYGSVSGARNWHYGMRGKHGKPGQHGRLRTWGDCLPWQEWWWREFMAPDIVSFCQFLGPEIVKMGQHISGPRNWHIFSVSGPNSFFLPEFWPTEKEKNNLNKLWMMYEFNRNKKNLFGPESDKMFQFLAPETYP